MTASDHLKHRTGSLGGDQDENGCKHRRLIDPREVDSVGKAWKCASCGALFPESAIDMKFSPEWLLRVAKEEEDVRFSVGGLVSDVPYSPADMCWCQPFDRAIHPNCPMHGRSE